ncbi:MAG: YigZ family protein [Tannerellaceae bacterium]|jgi:uncharacterized YigZ family protein|nr:YigZ family protein [Tannerellaceae bacterium]
MPRDTYKTIPEASQGYFTEKRSRFLSFAIPISSLQEVKETLAFYKRNYHDARHICWAYMLGSDRDNFHSSDDGEPSSTAGRPILGEINSRGLTNIMIIVVRYFGGIELGAGGLTSAYRAAASSALSSARVVDMTVDASITVSFGYSSLNLVARIIKEEDAIVVSRTFGEPCRFTVKVRLSRAEVIAERLTKAGAIHC